MSANSYAANKKDIPPTPADAAMRKTHTTDSVKYNLNHTADHGQAMMGSLQKLQGVNPKQATQMAQMVNNHVDKIEAQLAKYGAKDKGDSMAQSNTTKKTGSFQGKSNALGGGGRAAQLKAKGLSGALISYIGRKKYGSKAFAAMSNKGRSKSNS